MSHSPGQITPGCIRIVSFNIRFDNPDDGDDCWRHRREHVCKLLKDYNSSIFCLQEALKNQVLDVASQMLEYTWVGVGRDDGHDKGEFCPIFYHRNQMRVHSSDTFWLSATPEKIGSLHPKAALPRICTWVRLDPTEGRPFFVFNTHFDHESEEARKFSAQLLLKKVNEIAGLYPAVLAADLNSFPRSQPWVIMQDSFFKDSFSAMGISPHPLTFTGFDEEGTDDGAGATLDYLFVSGFTVKKTLVITRVRPNKRRISDHRPVLADITSSA